MKLVLALAVLFIAAQSQAADLTGTWTSTGTTCASGVPMDPPQAKSDDTLVLTANSMFYTMREVGFNGCMIELGPVAIAMSADKITPTEATSPMKLVCPGNVQTDTSEVNEMSYSLASDVLTLTSQPGKTGNPCPVGDRQVLTFTKAK